MTEQKHTPEKRLRFKRQPRATGLAAVAQATRGYDLLWGNDLMAVVNAHTRQNRHETERWYWVTYDAKPYVNSCSTVMTLGEAKKAAREHVKKYIAAISRAIKAKETP